MKREKFLKIYSDIPLNLRKEIILVLPEIGPITWNAAYLEVSNNTRLSETILEKLEKLNII